MFKPGQIFFTTEKGDWISDYIRWFERQSDPNAEFTHCGIIISDEMVNTLTCQPDALMFEATWPRIKKSLLDKYVDYDSKTVILEYSTPDLIELNSIIDIYNGKSYGVFNLLGQAVFKLFKFEIHPLLKGIVCCRLLLKWFERFMPNFCHVDDAVMDVNQTYKACLAEGWKLKAVCDYGTKTFVEVNND